VSFLRHQCERLMMRRGLTSGFNNPNAL
jgi:hypothetical protein